jgi:hypothetical protein
MGHFVSQAAFDRIAIPMPEVGARPLSSCCQQAVSDALETAASTGSIATITMLATVTMLMVGFAFGLTTAWVLFG